jgi:hypothetical protein
VKQSGILEPERTKGKSKRSVTDCFCKALKQGRKAWEKKGICWRNKKPIDHFGSSSSG